MRRKLIVGNWKMHGNLSANAVLINAVRAAQTSFARADCAVCVPFPYLAQAQSLLAGSAIAWGAQNLSDHTKGAFTGEIAGPMIKEFGCRYVLVGHSERRALYGEHDAWVARKFAAAQHAGLTPILCVGETLEEREDGVTEKIVARQLETVLSAAGIDSFASAVLAYEPVWAIGTGRTATPQDAAAVHRFLRAQLAGADPALAQSARILYGGSVKGANAAQLLVEQDIDGALVGGASLNAEEFIAICSAAPLGN